MSNRWPESYGLFDILSKRCYANLSYPEELHCSQLPGVHLAYISKGSYLPQTQPSHAWPINQKDVKNITCVIKRGLYHGLPQSPSGLMHCPLEYEPHTPVMSTE